MGSILGGLPIVGGMMGGGDSGGGGLLGGGGGLGGMLGGLPIVGGMFGGGGGGGQAPGAIPQGWMNTQGMPMPGGAPGYPVQPMQPNTQYNFQGDLSKAGPAESFYAQNQGKFTQPTQAGGFWNANQSKFGAPGQGEQYWNKVSGQFNAPKAAAQNAQGAYDQFQQSTPQDMSPYYDNAVRKANAKINNDFAARGMFNTSAATGALADADTNLYSQMAKDQADYGLARGGLAGNLASGADTSSRGASQNMLSWLSGGGNLANAVDSNSLARLMGGMGAAGGADSGNLSWLLGGMNAAGNAQDALTNRAQGYYNNLLGLGNAQAGAMAGTYNPMIAGDMGMLDQSVQASLGYPRESLNQSLNGRASSEQGIGNLFGLFGGGKSGGLLGGIL